MISGGVVIIGGQPDYDCCGSYDPRDHISDANVLSKREQHFIDSLVGENVNGILDNNEIDQFINDSQRYLNDLSSAGRNDLVERFQTLVESAQAEKDSHINAYNIMDAFNLSYWQGVRLEENGPIIETPFNENLYALDYDSDGIALLATLDEQAMYRASLAMTCYPQYNRPISGLDHFPFYVENAHPYEDMFFTPFCSIDFYDWNEFDRDVDIEYDVPKVEEIRARALELISEAMGQDVAISTEYHRWYMSNNY